MMKPAALKPTLRAACSAVALLVLSAPALADIGLPGQFKCTDSRAANPTLNPSFVECSAHFDNVPAPKSTLVEPFAGFGDFKFVGQTTNASDSLGPFKPFGPGKTRGSLDMYLPQTGSFVIALASFNDYSLYLYDASKLGPVASIAFSTLGTTDELGQPYQLEYANLYAPVPEPAGVALMLAGLALTGLAVRRRKA